MKNPAISQEIFKILCFATKSHGQAFGVQTTVLQNLQYYEHLAEPMAEVIKMLAFDFDYFQLGEEVLRCAQHVERTVQRTADRTMRCRDISGKTFNDKTDAKGCKSFSRFIVHLSEILPRIVLKQISLLQSQLDSEAYQIRNAIVEALGHIIRELVRSSALAEGTDQQQQGEDGGEEPQREAGVQSKQIDTCFELMLDRFLDLNSHVRSKAVATTTKLLECVLLIGMRRCVRN